MSIHKLEGLNFGDAGSKVLKSLIAGISAALLAGCANPNKLSPKNDQEVALAQVIEYKKVGKHPQVKQVSGGVEVIEYFHSTDEKVFKPVKYTITNESILKRLGLDPKVPYCKKNNLYNAGEKVPSFTCKVEKKDGVNKMIITTN